MECSLRAARPRPARRAAGPRRRRADVVGGRDGRQGRGRASTSTSPGCRCARPAWSRSRSWSPSRRSGCCASSSPPSVDAVLAVCARWEVGATPIGDVTDDRRVRDPRRRPTLVGEMPVARARRRLPALRPRSRRSRPTADLPAAAARRSPPRTPAQTLLALLASPNIASRRPALRAVRRDRAVPHRAPPRAGRRRRAAAPGPRRPSRRLAVGDRRQRPPRRLRPSTAGRSRRCSSARPTWPASGAEPLGMTNCLNFGNPEKPHVAWQLTRVGRAASATPAGRSACRSSAATSRSTTRPRDGPIYPTPVIGMVGALPDARRAGRLGFQRPATRSPSSARSPRRCRGSELAQACAGRAPARDCPASRHRRRPLGRPARCATAVRAGVISSAHDIAEGGLAMALAECCLAGGIGASIGSTTGRAAAAEALFGEGPGGFVVSAPAVVLGELAREVPLHRSAPSAATRSC